MTIHAALTNPALKRVIALTAVYVLALQALFGAGAQVRVLLSEAPGLCTILGFQDPSQPKHAADACTVHCVGHAASDMAGLAAPMMLVLALGGWTLAQNRSSRFTPRLALAFQGRAPPR